jgi:dTDP-4-amino-4,6-dideoxygalactose transaminase
LVDLRAAHAEVATEVAQGWARVLADAAFILGPDVAAFEREFAQFTGVRHCVGVANGTDALELAVRAAGLGPGDEVILPVNTFIATALAVARAGATPVFADCDPHALLLDPEAARARVGPRARAIVAVHLYGQSAPMEDLAKLAQRHGLLLMEDHAQSQGATRHGRPCGAMGLAAATSFYPGKNIGAYGDAGAVLTDDDRLAQRVRDLRNYGGSIKYEHPETGFNSRLDTLQAVVLRAKLRGLADGNQARRAAAALYDALLAELPEVRRLSLLPGNVSVHHLYPVRVPRRDAVLRAMQAEGVGVGIHYPKPLHLQGAFASMGHRPGDFPHAERAAAELLSLPIYPQITPGQQRRVVSVLKESLTQRG